MKKNKIIKVGYYLALFFFVLGFVLRITLANDTAITVTLIGAIILLIDGMYSYLNKKGNKTAKK